LSSTTATTTASIAAVAVTPVVTAASKTYDGTVAATLTSCTVSGLMRGDGVTCYGVAHFDTPTAGLLTTVTATNIPSSGAADGNEHHPDGSRRRELRAVERHSHDNGCDRRGRRFAADGHRESSI